MIPAAARFRVIRGASRVLLADVGSLRHFVLNTGDGENTRHAHHREGAGRTDCERVDVDDLGRGIAVAIAIKGVGIGIKPDDGLHPKRSGR